MNFIIADRDGALKYMRETKNRSELLRKVEIIKEKFTNKSIFRPPHWTGYLLIPNLIEFWQNMPHRLHDRVEYRKTESGWEARNLYP